MTELRRTSEFDRWLTRLRNQSGKAKILIRIQRLADGNAGDVAAIGEGLSELRIDFGPGYRVYFCTMGKTVILLLGGGDKSTQNKDIQRAKALASEWRGRDGSKI